MGALAGRTALVTGGGTGIGFAIARHLLADGAVVTICGRRPEVLESAAAALRDLVPGAEVASIAADVTREADVEAAVARAAAPTGSLGILVANAGGSLHMGSIPDADADAVRATVDVNLVGTFLCIKHAATAMRDGGAIVGMSSGAGHFPHRFLPAYGAAKAGIDMLCRYAAEELAERGIRVNSVQPGIIGDELMAPITAGSALLDDYLENIPLGRIGTVDDVARLVRFLVSPESAWITGVSVPVDGGHHLRRGANYQRLFG